MISYKFLDPIKNTVFTFPRDHGTHNDYRIEWWYLVGHLEDASKKNFHFQITFFRKSRGDISHGGSQYFIAHTAILGPGNKTYFEERTAQQKSFVSFSASRLDLQYEDLKLMLNDNTGLLHLNMTSNKKVELNLECKPIKNVIAYDRAVSRRGTAVIGMTHCITFPRLDAKGTICINGDKLKVNGLAWMDHEFAGQLPPSWDWAGIQLHEDEEIFVGRSRHKDGTIDMGPYLTRVLKDGTTLTTLCTWEILDTWKSPQSGVLYPVKVRIIAEKQTLEIHPLAYDQEKIGQFLRYWEGACKVTDDKGKVIGQAFLELIGYK